MEDDSLKSMSDDLVNDVPSTVTAALNEIEEKSRALHSGGLAAGQFSIGPFRVCRFEPEPATTVERQVTASDTAGIGGVGLGTPCREARTRTPKRLRNWWTGH